MKIVNILISILITYLFILTPAKVEAEVLPTEITPIYGTTNHLEKGAIMYVGRVIRLKKEDELKYRTMHADVWPEIIAVIYKANIRNYQLYVGTIDNKRYLFSHFEYHGTDIKKDFGTIRDNPIMKNKWLPITDSYQIKMPNTDAGQQWLKLESIMQLK